MPIPDDLRNALVLQLVPGLGPRTTAALLERFGSVEEVLKASPADLAQVPHIGDKTSRELHRALHDVDVEAEWALVEKHRVRLAIRETADYPSPLAAIANPPHLLYVKGRLTSADDKAIALVGSRHGTAYGRRVAERLAADLAERGYTIVSGLARGVDGAAHRGALKVGGRTIAVLAGGLSRIYPPEHTELAEQIIPSGALITEASMAVAPLPDMFPARNRLISGLSRGVILVEAAERSGALITARHAAEQGKTLFAVPGPIDSAASAGCLKMLREGAILIRGVDDVIEELEGVAAGSPAKPTAPAIQLNPDQQRIWDALEEPAAIDTLAERLGCAVPELLARLTILEMKKVVERRPGNVFQRR